MYNWVTTRKIARTEGPNYPARAAQTVDAVVAKWIPVTAALLACAVTPARAKMDVRAYDWAPAFTWVQPVVDAQVRTWMPASTAELQSSRVRERPPLDVRRYEWNSEESAWIAGILTTPPTVAQTWPAFQQSALSARTPDGPRLDVRRYEWQASTAWLAGPFAQIAATVAVPAAAQLQQPGVTALRKTLDVRAYDWAADEASWIVATQTSAPTVAQTAPAWTNHAQNFRTASRPALDLFRAQSIPDSFGVPDDWITWAPLQDTGGRTRERARLDVRAYDWGQPAWIYTSIPNPITDAQKWPAILQASGLPYRTPARPSLDVRSYDWAPAFSWVQPVVDAAIARLAPVFRAELSGFRTADDPRLDVRAFAWAPDAGGWILASFAPPATSAQIVPAVLQNLGTEYRTATRAPLDVRRYEWQPAFTWVSRVVDATVATWAPIFRAQESPRTPARPDAPLSRHVLDVAAPVYEYLGLVPFPDLFLTTTVTSRMPARTVVSRLPRYTVRLTREDDV